MGLMEGNRSSLESMLLEAACTITVGCVDTALVWTFSPSVPYMTSWSATVDSECASNIAIV